MSKNHANQRFQPTVKSVTIFAIAKIAPLFTAAEAVVMLKKIPRGQPA